MKRKKCLSLLLSLCLSFSLAAPALAAGIPDGWTPADGARMEEKPWYAEAQAYVLEKGLMVGTDQGFEPYGIVSKATVLQTLYNKEGKPNATENADPWYADAAAWASENGIAELEEDAEINRGDVKAILEAYCALKGTHPESLMKGNENGDMMLDKTLSRAELAQILVRLDALQPYYAESVVSIDVDEQEEIPAHAVPGTLCVPAVTEGKRLPAVVMLHGTGSNRDEAGSGYKIAAPIMAENGVVTLRIDFMGNGDSTADYKDYNYTSANLDAKAAADYLASLDYVDADKIAVLGWSQGGTNALLAAKAYPETFKAVVTWSGALDLTTMFEDFDAAYETAKTDGGFEMEFDWRDSLQVGERWFKEVKETDMAEAITGLEAPVLAINGDLDDTVPMSNAETIAASVANGALYIVKGADHTYNVFSGDFSAINETINAGIKFLQEKLNGVVAGTVTEVEKYGHAVLDVKIEDFQAKGFELGDIVTVAAGSYSGDMPYFNGYYVDNGEYMLRAYPGKEYLAVCINYGKFNVEAGVDVGSPVYISLKTKGGAATTQAVYSLEYTNDRADYASDEVFANFRPIVMGDIAEGRLYRSASPINNEYGRAATADQLISAAGVKTVVNLANTQEEIDASLAAEDFNSPYYKGLLDAEGVIVLGMPVNFASDEFAEGIVKGLIFMSEHEGPYMVHCTEGKDRAGFTAALLEALMGAKLEEIVDDYLESYVNYYHLDREADAKKLELIAEKNINEMLRTIAGLDKGAELADVDLAAAAETYLTSHGMTAEQVSALKTALSK